MNPADLPSRGCTPRELLRSKWWEGPDWLKFPKGSWPSQEPYTDEEVINKERKKTAVVLTNLKEGSNPWYCSRFSLYLKNVRVMAWILRYLKKIRKASQEKDELSQEEVKDGEEMLFRLVQKESFQMEEDKAVISGIRVKKMDGLLRVETKLTHRKDETYFLHPILLPNDHALVDQMIRQEHKKSHHAGIQFLMGKLREKCWILQGRKAVNRIVRSCVVCRLHSEKSPTVPESPLPEDRVKNAKAFEVSGVDLAGPLFLKEEGKSWIVLFTCAVYRCVHLELVNSLSTDAFLLALHRFISRRGRPVIIYSDNGTNFVGTENLFKSLDWRRIERETRLQRIKWKFNPPSAAWWGGFWERLIRSVKDLLKRTLGHRKLNFVQMETCLCEVEAIVNGRPLTYITEDTEDLIPLTPAMFLQDMQVSQFPEADALDGEGLRSSYEGLKKMKEEIRCRFRKEYLANLLQRAKGKKPHEFSVGDIVNIASDNKKRLEWPLGKIEELLPGRDGKVRVAKVKTANGYFSRPLQRLFPLEVTSKCVPISDSVKVKAVESAKSVIANDVRNAAIKRSIKGRLLKRPVWLGYVNISHAVKI
jgi:hypothetical protein